MIIPEHKWIPSCTLIQRDFLIARVRAPSSAFAMSVVVKVLQCDLSIDTSQSYRNILLHPIFGTQVFLSSVQSR
jgi:hypothetical protein